MHLAGRVIIRGARAGRGYARGGMETREHNNNNSKGSDTHLNFINNNDNSKTSMAFPSSIVLVRLSL